MTNPSDASFRTYLTDMTFREHLRAYPPGSGSGAADEQEHQENGAAGNGNVNGNGSGNGNGSSDSQQHFHTQHQQHHLVSPHALTFANHVAVQVATPRYTRRDFGLFAIVSVARQHALSHSPSQSQSSSSVHNGNGHGHGHGHGAEGKAAPSEGPALVAGLLDRTAAYWFLGIFGAWVVGTPGWASTFLEDAAAAVRSREQAHHAEGREKHGGKKNANASASAAAAAVAENLEAARWGVKGMSNEFSDDQGEPAAAAHEEGCLHGLASTCSHSHHPDAPDCTEFEAAQLAQQRLLEQQQEQDGSADAGKRSSRQLLRQDLQQQPPSSSSSSSAAHQSGPSGSGGAAATGGLSASGSASGLSCAQNAAAAAKARKRKGPISMPGVTSRSQQQQLQQAQQQGQSGKATPSPPLPRSGSSDSAQMLAHASGGATPSASAGDLFRDQPLPSSASSEGPESFALHSAGAAAVTATPAGTEGGTEQSELDGLIAAVAASRSSITELESQISNLTSTNDSVRAQLQQQLEELRARKKEEDTVRSDLRGKMKSLDESKRLSELHRKEAERKLRAAVALEEGYESRIEQKIKTIESLKRKAEQADDRLVKSRTERQKREEELQRDKVIKADEVSEAEQRNVALLEHETELQKRLLAARSGLEQARLRLRQRRAAAFETAVREASAAALRQQHQQQLEQIHQQQQALAAVVAMRQPAGGEDDITASESLFDPTAAKDPSYAPMDGFSGMPHPSADYGYGLPGDDLPPHLVAPVPLSRFGFDGRPDDYNGADEDFHDADDGQEQAAPEHYGLHADSASLGLRERAFYTASPSALNPNAPVSPFSTGLLPSNLFQNLDDEGRADLVSPSHVNSTFARFGIEPDASDDESARSDLLRQAQAQAEAVAAAAALSQKGASTDDGMDTDSEAEGAEREAAEDKPKISSDQQAQQKGTRPRSDSDRKDAKTAPNRRNWWGKRASRDHSVEPPSTPGQDSSVAEEMSPSVSYTKRRSFGMFPKLGASSRSARASPSTTGNKEDARQIPNISRPIGPLIPLSQNVEGSVAADYESVRRAFQLPVGAEDDESGRRSWSAFDNWQANTGAVRRAVPDGGANGSVPYDPRFSSDSLPIALQNRPASIKSGHWRDGSGSQNDLSLNKTISSEIPPSETGSQNSRTRSSRFAFWSSPSRSSHNNSNSHSHAAGSEKENSSVSQASDTDEQRGTSASGGDDGASAASPPGMTRSISRKRFWSRASEVEPEHAS